MKSWIIIPVTIILAVIMLRYYIRGKHPVRNFLFGAGSGIAALLLAYVVFIGLGRTFSVNYLTIALSAFSGIPGVAAMVVGNILFQV